jgi:hypothetical protein
MGQIFQFGTMAHLKWQKGSISPQVKRFIPFVERSHFPQKGRKGRRKDRTPLQLEYDEWWDLRGSSGSENSIDKQIKDRSQLRPEVPSLHRIYLNGKMETIPEAMLVDLDMVTELGCDDYLTFRADSWTAYPQRRDNNKDDQGFGYAEGTVWVPGWETDWGCIVHNVPAHHADKVGEATPWQIMPYGVTTQVAKRFGCSIMGRVRKYLYEVEDDMPEPRKLEDPKGDSEDTLAGPFGHFYVVSEWERLTRRGCGHCSRNLLVEDAEHIWWVGEGEQTPLCSDCCDVLTKPIESDDDLENLNVH